MTDTVSDGARGASEISHKATTINEKLESIKLSAQTNKENAKHLEDIISKFEV